MLVTYRIGRSDRCLLHRGRYQMSLFLRRRSRSVLRPGSACPISPNVSIEEVNGVEVLKQEQAIADPPILLGAVHGVSEEEKLWYSYCLRHERGYLVIPMSIAPFDSRQRAYEQSWTKTKMRITSWKPMRTTGWLGWESIIHMSEGFCRGRALPQGADKYAGS